MSERVTVQDFAEHLNMAADTALAMWRNKGFEPEPDWCDRWSLSEAEARVVYAEFVSERDRAQRERSESESVAEAKRHRVREHEQSIMDTVVARLRSHGIGGGQAFTAGASAVRRVRDGEDEEQVIAEVVIEARRSTQTTHAGVPS